jgi:hypothetical protein
MPMTLTVLSFIMLFLAVFALGVVIIRKLEETKDFDMLKKRKQQSARAESDSAWILNKLTPMR